MIEGHRVYTEFALNVKGVTQTTAIIVGSINAVADGTASKLYENNTHRNKIMFILTIVIGLFDFLELTTIIYSSARSDTQAIILSTNNDQITLEYEDRIQLTFTPDNPSLIANFEDIGEYIRDFSTINIVDNDSKWLYEHN